MANEGTIDRKAIGERVAGIYNRAQDAVAANNRDGAVSLYQQALSAQETLPDLNPYEALWRAMILYRLAVNLQKIHGLEGCSIIPAGKSTPAELARDSWAECLELLDWFPPDALRNAGARFGFDFPRAYGAVKQDALFNAARARESDGLVHGILAPSSRRDWKQAG